MAAIYVGVNGVARKVSKVYVGVGGVARKVKSVYVGVNNIARKCYSSEPKIKVYSTSFNSDSTLKNTYPDNGTETSSYAAFCGTNGVAEFFNKNLTKTSKSVTSGHSSYCGASVNDTYILFAGEKIKNVSYKNEIISFNKSLTMSILSDTYAYESLSGNYIGSYGMIVGGIAAGNSQAYNNAYFYNSTLTRSSASNLSNKPGSMVSTCIKTSHVLFAGGVWSPYPYNYKYYFTDAYNTSITKTSISQLSSHAGNYMAACHVGNLFYVFAGGETSSSTNAIDGVTYYNSSLTRSTSTLTVARNGPCGISLNNFCVIEGGLNVSSSYADVFNTSFSRSTINGGKSFGVHRGAVINNYGISIKSSYVYTEE